MSDPGCGMGDFVFAEERVIGNRDMEKRHCSFCRYGVVFNKSYIECRYGPPGVYLSDDDDYDGPCFPLLVTKSEESWCYRFEVKDELDE